MTGFLCTVTITGTIAPEDMIMLDPDIWRNFWGLKISKTEASWNVSKDTYTNSPFFEPQNDVVLQFKLHEINSTNLNYSRLK